MLNAFLIVIGFASSGAQATTPTPPAIVFVCEHGAAKSVIATGYFNKLAAERGLSYRATFRGTSPQDDVSVRAVAALKEDGIAVPSGSLRPLPTVTLRMRRTSSRSDARCPTRHAARARLMTGPTFPMTRDIDPCATQS
jgi:low molecular weight phosphotyrosine protein phosphatase